MFVEMLQPLLLNVLFLIVFLLFIPLILELNVNAIFNRYKSWIINVAALLAIICCMTFPITIMEGYIFDLRLIALTIVGLYGGVPSILILSVITVTYRFILGGIGGFASLIAISILSAMLILSTKMFRQMTKQKKVYFGTALALVASAIAVLNSTIIFGQNFSIQFLISYLFITLVTTALIIYFKEIFHESILISQRVIKAEKMEIVSHLASSVSHEVRNPLTVIRGFLQMMLRKEIPEHQKNKFLEISIAEIDRANDIIRNYLTYAKPTPENIKLINVKEELERTLQIMMPLVNMNGIIVETKLSDYFINGEEQTFQQCLINLIKNCIEAMPNHGRLYVETAHEGNNLKMTISDTGKGMTKEQLSRLGEPYYTTKGREGTGLGMMAVLRIIETLNGKLTVTSRENEGTIFTIYLPLANKRNKAQ